ncbi:phosphoribosylamine--glycine ligase [Roseomonas sp. BN140053]|uniref:phosphoribosylamine--glycine ligase n=1 Tax=Roseomonas sp. BN140053 TaxID=3391898 RepID=UPI0039ED4C83
MPMPPRLPAAPLLLLLLASCGQPFRQPPPPGPPASPQEAACRAQANSSPAVKDVMRRQPPAERVTAFEGWELDVRAARQRAVRDCLVGSGASLPGGVEAVRPPGSNQGLGRLMP